MANPNDPYLYGGQASPNDVKLRAVPFVNQYALIAAVGAFVLAGIAAQGLAGHVVAAASGTFVETGQTSTPTVGRLMSAQTGAFVETGIGAGLGVAHVESVARGTFALTGQAATGTESHRLAVAAGTFVLTGQATGEAEAHKLSAAVGTFLQTGQAAGLTEGRRIAAAPVEYVESGQSVQGLVARAIPDAVQTFALTGNAETLARGLLLPAGVGSIVETGQDADGSYTPSGVYSLQAVVVPYVATGQAATLDVSGSAQKAAVAGLYLPPLMPRYWRRLVPQIEALPGAVVVSGQPATCTVGRSITAQAGVAVGRSARAALIVSRQFTATSTRAQAVWVDGALRRSRRFLPLGCDLVVRASGAVGRCETVLTWSPPDEEAVHPPVNDDEIALLGAYD